MTLQILLLSVIVVMLALIGLGVKLLFKKDGTFEGGSCNHVPLDLREKGIGCACGEEENCNRQ